MGKITESLLGILDVEYSIVDFDTTEGELETIFLQAKKTLEKDKQYAIIYCIEGDGLLSNSKSLRLSVCGLCRDIGRIRKRAGICNEHRRYCIPGSES